MRSRQWGASSRPVQGTHAQIGGPQPLRQTEKGRHTPNRKPQFITKNKKDIDVLMPTQLPFLCIQLGIHLSRQQKLHLPKHSPV